jgi:hypothetical protein
METKVINVKDLTAACWLVQFWGLEACEKCEIKDTPECGGQEIRKGLLEKGQHGKVTVTGLPEV